MTAAHEGTATRLEGPGRAVRITVAALGLLAAFAGIEHAVGEIRQGAVAPPAWVFESWPGTPAFAALDGEPAMTVVPILLVTGILAVAVSLAVGGWAVGYAGGHGTAHHLVLLAVLLLLVGGGFGPPLVAMLAALLAIRAGGRNPRRLGHDTRKPLTDFLARSWPWALVLTVTSFLALVPGVPLLYVAAGVDSAVLVSAIMVSAFTSTAVTLVAAPRRDLYHLAGRGRSSAGVPGRPPRRTRSTPPGT
jgi:hypothetical protein